jgi:hypothetical protein
MKIRSALLFTWLVVLAFIVIGMALKYWLIEPEHMGAACMADQQPWWCYPRLVLVLGMIYGWWGGAAIALVCLSVYLRPETALPWLLAGMAIASLALVIYSAGWASVALLTGLLRAISLSTARLPVTQLAVSPPSASPPPTSS